MRRFATTLLLLSTISACRAPEEVTYLSIDGSNRSFLGGPQEIRPEDGWTFEAGAAERSVGCHIHQGRTHYHLAFSAGLGEQVEVGHYEDKVRQFHKDSYPSLYIDAHGYGSSEITGWFDVHEIKLTSDKKGVKHLSVDFLMIEDGGFTAFGRLRYKATVNPPPPTPEQIVAALKSKRNPDDPEVDLTPPATVGDPPINN
jgi:hypothetical protein